MSVNFFIIESLGAGDTQSLDPEKLRMQVYQHFSEQNCKSRSDCLQPMGAEEVAEALTKFAEWASRLEDDPILLILSLHGDPSSLGTGHMATSGVSGIHSPAKPDIVHWWKVFGKVKWPSNCTVLADCCWGGSPSVARGTTRRGNHPRFVFGPTRPATAIEMGTARHLLVSMIAKHQDMNESHAKEVVDILNNLFRPNEQETAFFRVWIWKDEVPVAYPPLSGRVQRK